MRILIHILVGLIAILLLNIVGYIVSEDYRFFLKKIKYQDSVVYDSNTLVNDTNQLKIIDTSSQKVGETKAIQTTGTGFTFLDIFSGKEEIKAQNTLPALTQERKDFIARFDSYSLVENLKTNNLFGLTSQFPDPYYEFSSDDLTLYLFPTKTYSEIQKIFRVLEYETPFTLNETNTFGTASFFINLDERFTDDSVRIILEYQNATFGLKIKKDMYNDIKKILNTLS